MPSWPLYESRSSESNDAYQGRKLQPAFFLYLCVDRLTRGIDWHMLKSTAGPQLSTEAQLRTAIARNVVADRYQLSRLMLCG